jgi:hypothetical protein
VGDGRSIVIWQQPTAAGRRRPQPPLPRFQLYDYELVAGAKKLIKQPQVLEALEQQLANCISSLQDEEVTLEQHTSNQQATSSHAQAAAAAAAAAAAPALSWRAGVERRPVPEGHRAFSHVADMSGQQQMQAVFARRAFPAGGLIGMYLGYVYGSLEVAVRRMFQSAADLSYFIYQHEFEVAAPAGAYRQQDNSSSSSRGREVNDFIIDATCCLEGNPLAHMLDYRAVQLSSSGRLAYPLRFLEGRSIADGPKRHAAAVQ